MATTALRIEKPDEVLATHAEWQCRARAAGTAYQAWRDAERSERACRWAAYVAQLDGEQRAAEAYADALRRAAERPAAPAPAAGDAPAPAA
jgi:hypothetical protein